MLFKFEKIQTKFGLKIKDFEISKDKVTFIMGRSGIGKSSALKLLNRTESIQKGNIYYESKNIIHYDPIFLRKEVLLVSQSSYLFLGSIQNNFDKFRKLRGSTPIQSEQMQSYLSLCALDLPLEALSQNLSGGEKHRVYLAIFISFLPKVLLVDEPTAALDEKTGDQLISNIKTFCLNKGIKLIVVTHERTLAEKFGEELIEMEER